jgi:ATP-binding cassette subfamily B protein
MRFYDPKEGEILFDGSALKDLCLRDLRKNIGKTILNLIYNLVLVLILFMISGMVQQNTELFGGTIEENITYGLEPGSWTREDVIQAAKNACAHDFIKSFPEGYHTRVGERGIRISGGQKQRIAIARVFLRKPKILLLDEATSALDAESEAKVQEALDKLMSEKIENRTVVLVAHRLSTVINADQIAVIGEGRILEKGSHEQLLAMGGEYAALFIRQMKKRSSIIDMDSNQQHINS